MKQDIIYIYHTELIVHTTKARHYDKYAGDLIYSLIPTLYTGCIPLFTDKETKI